MITNIQNKNAITLISLVVTVIVLLILTGVAITTLTGENGILGMAKNAREKVKLQEEKELISIAANSAKVDDRINVEKENLQKELDKTSIKGATAMMDGKNIVVKVEERYYTIESNGNILGPDHLIEDEYAGDFTKGGLYNGESEQSTYKINCIEDLIELSKQSNTGNNYKDCYFELTRNLDFNSISSYSDYKTTKYDEYLGGDGTTELKTQLSSDGNGYKPIGNFRAYDGKLGFSGDFNGKNNKIENIYIDYNTTEAYLGGGIFGRTSNDAVIRNLTIGGNVKSDTSLCGGVVGYARENTIINNCYNYCNVEANGYAGGIVGLNDINVKIINCGNYGNITMKYKSDYAAVGGITGIITSIKNCFNQGKIYNAGLYVYSDAGGIVGNEATRTSEIENCYNKGSVDVGGKREKGAIVGGFWYSTFNSTLNKCYYLNSSCNQPVGSHSLNITEGTISCTEDYMKDGSLLEELNKFVKNYNEEHKNDENFIELRKWIAGKDKYPIININN